MRRKTLSAVVLCASAAIGGSVLAVPPASAAPTVRSDFNGDGYADLAVGVPGGTADGKARAGFVSVLWGSVDGLGGSASRIGQAASGIPGTPKTGDQFGFAVQSGDLNGDGYGDLAVTAPGEQTGGGSAHEGAAYVLWGSEDGLRSGFTAAKGRGDVRLGRLLTVGDYDGDGTADLALAQNGEEGGATVLRPGPLAPGTSTDATLVSAYGFGDARALATGDFDGDGTDDLAAAYSGLEIGGTHVRSLASGSWKDIWTASDSGSALAAGDFDGDGTADLAIGLVEPDAEADGTYCEDRLGGAVATVLGAAGTTLGGPASCTTQSSPSVGGAAEPEDNFGAALAAADLDGDGSDALLVGASHEAIGTAERAGAYWELRTGGDGALTGPAVNQDSAGVAGTAETGDLFGAALSAGPYSGSAHADQAVGAPGEAVSADDLRGGVWYRPSAGTAPRPPAVSLTPGRLGATGAVAYGGVLAR
ncbi:VCBS repeat-containing protein [Streptomyces fructofermentans]|uniref:VCBS repeat-containing protein n=1 Tax=Streptomyces fructofermentans TaxID=152141 RepID=UPI0033C3022D